MASATSRARPDRPPAGCTVEEKVRYIAELMASGDYHSYATRVELAKAWGNTEGTIRSYTAEASRLVTLDPEERERMRITSANRCRKVYEEASSSRSQVTGLPDYGNALKAIELEGRFMGITLDDKKVELTGKGGGPVAVTLDDIDTALGAASKNDAGSKEPDDDGGDAS